MGVITLFFLIVAIAGVYSVGCQIPGNLLFAIAGTKLGWQAHHGGVILAMLSMQLVLYIYIWVWV
jgi:vesicular inhibitory amino acid transporter